MRPIPHSLTTYKHQVTRPVEKVQRYLSIHDQNIQTSPPEVQVRTIVSGIPVVRALGTVIVLASPAFQGLGFTRISYVLCVAFVTQPFAILSGHCWICCLGLRGWWLGVGFVV
jgi:hypothetical protein